MVAALLAATASIAPPAHAAPPPPGWAEEYRARVCGQATPSQTVEMHVRILPPRRAGVRLAKSAPVDVAWAVDLDLPHDVKPVGITMTFNQGILLLSADGRWIRIAASNEAITGGSVEAHAIGDGARPKTVSAESDGTVATIQEDGSTIARYDLRFCGYGAKAQPAFRLPAGAEADVVAEVGPNLGGFVQNRYILVAGRQGGRPGQLAFWPVEDGNDVVRPFEAPFVRVPDGQTLALLAGFDIAGGCDAIVGIRDKKGSTTFKTFCKPGYADDPIMLLGDVGLSVIRTPKAVRDMIDLATFSVPVLGAAQGPYLKDGRAQLLILARAPEGATRIFALSGNPAKYSTRK